MSDIKCCVGEHYPLETKDCQGEVEEVYGTDGGTAPVCEFHFKQFRHAMRDDGYPITKRYYDEVYGPVLDFEHDCHDQMTAQFKDPEKGFNRDALVDWLKTDEGKARRAKIAKEIEEKRQQLRDAFLPKGKKRWWGMQ